MSIQFAKGRHYEERIVQAILIDDEFAQRMMEVLDINYFTQESLRELVRIYFAYHNKYQAFPSVKLIATLIEDIKSETIQEAIKAYFIRIQKEPMNGDIDYVKETSLEFCRKRKLMRSLKQAVQQAEDGNYDSIVQNIQKAMLVGSERDVGHVYDEDLEKRYLPNIRNPVPTPWIPINNILKGGPGIGELNIVLAPPNVGKSHILVALGADCVKRGGRVVHYTLEMADYMVGQRYDANFSGIPCDELEARKDQLKEIISGKVKGKLIIKSYPTKTASAATLKNHLNRLGMQDFYPDMIVVDYGDLLRASEQSEARRYDLASVYEELRALAQELGIPVWTASQPNRISAKSEDITLEGLSESYEKAMISDFVLSFQRSDEDMRAGTGRFFIAKNRNGKSRVKYLVEVDTACSRFEIMTDRESELENELETMDSKERMKERYKQFLADKNKENP